MALTQVPIELSSTPGIVDNSNTTAITIDSSENVGIGTDLPVSTLELANNNQAAGSTLSITNSFNGADWNTNDLIGTIDFRTDDTSTSQPVRGSIKSIVENTAGATSPAYTALSFSTASVNTLTERMRIDSSGNVGIGTQATGSASSKQLLSLVNPHGNTGAAAQLWLSGTNATTRGAYIEAEVQSTGNDHALIFATSASSSTPSERMRIDASGNLLVGCTGLTNDAPNVDGSFRTGGGNFKIRKSTNGWQWFQFYGTSTNSPIGSISNNNNTAVIYATSSDKRLKENIADADDAGSKIDAIQVRKFDWKADGSHQDYGMIAQELQTVAPEAVSAPEDPDEMMGVDYSKLVPMLVKEIQSLRARVAQLEN